MSPKILVIEDNDINMDLMIFILTAFGLNVIPALNGLAGLAIAKAEVPDLIICDIHMPLLDGFGVLAALRSDPTTTHIPVVAITALAMAGDSERLLAAGFNGYLSKPVEFDQLRVTVSNHLPGWH